MVVVGAADSQLGSCGDGHRTRVGEAASGREVVAARQGKRAGGSFTDSGTVTIAKGTKLTIGGTNNTYTQSAGTTNLDGTLAGGNATVTGGLFQGAGTASKNLTIGGGGARPPPHLP